MGGAGVGGVRYTATDFYTASEEWGFNCGPGALCAVLNLTPNELRPHLLDFESKGYTNPTLMYGVLDGLGVKWSQCYRGDVHPAPEHTPWPRFGLVRVQWGGPWTKPGVPMRARYRQTHWVASRGEPSRREIFDVNGVKEGWLPFRIWAEHLMPWLAEDCVPKWDGRFWPTHGIEVSLAGRAAAAGEWGQDARHNLEAPAANGPGSAVEGPCAPRSAAAGGLPPARERSH